MNNKNDKLVSLIQVSEHLPYNRRPHILDYGNEHIQHIYPCFKKGNVYTELRTGRRITKTENMEEWLVMTGTVFQYPDGKNLLVSRRFADQQILIIETTEIRPTMVLRKIK